MGVLFGVIAAVLYGSGDYLGGRAATRADVRRVLVVSQSTAAIGAVLVCLVVEGHATRGDIGYGLLAGLSASLGLGLLYRGLAIGRAGVVAPLTAVAGAVVPITWGLITGERPSTLAMIGVVVAVGAAALIAREDDRDAEGRPAGIGIALTAGVVLGSGFVCYAAASEDSGAWPLLAARVAAVAVAAVAALCSLRATGTASDRIPVAGSTSWVGRAAGAGLADIAGTVALLAGVRTELALLVAAICALAPGFTVLWSWVILREHLARIQFAGIALALVGLVAIAAG